jgi:hypothetical protein
LRDADSAFESASDRPHQGEQLSPVIPFDLGSTDGERRAEPPRREGRRLPAALRLGTDQRREFFEALLDAASFEDLPGMWQAAILEASGVTRRTIPRQVGPLHARA